MLLLQHEGQTGQTTERLVWRCASDVYRADLPAILNQLLDGFVRSPGMDSVARLSPACIGNEAYESLLNALNAGTRRNVRFVDHGWHIELRSRLRQYLFRGLQRQLVATGAASDALIEDLLQHDLGV